jgi:threonine dehydratase
MVDVHRPVQAPEPADLRRAAKIMETFLEPTPLTRTDADIRLKLECWQPTGSFKVRGAFAALSALTDASRSAGVVAASTGNHALAIAHAAIRLELDATVVVPTTASTAKVEALARLACDLCPTAKALTPRRPTRWTWPATDQRTSPPTTTPT